ncbi:MAG: proline--tRNA ligase [Chloroflexi bacterium]|nr:proline--tRNA ligase [Chloroflexota bacterium]
MQDKDKYVEEIADRSDSFSRWYTDVILKAELADYAPVRGCMVIRPYGYTLWENMVALLDRRIKDSGAVNAYFPLLIPESFLAKEAEHVAGFSPQVAWVTQGGMEVLEERLAVRPTSEAIIGHMYAKWIQSWRDLPLLINQWANVLRWEMVTRLFLRTTEFLWQEGHTAHATGDEAEQETLQQLYMYRDFFEQDLAIPVIPGLKTEGEKFAGALRTYSVEALMGDGKALQAATSHNLGQHFARVFDITFLDADGQRKYVWQTSWGLSTRTVGALIMVHGDDAGLILPPKVAPVQVIVVPIWRKEAEREVVHEAIRELEAVLKPSVRIKVDWSEEHTPGWKFNEWELRGVPLRIEVGPRDVKEGQAVLVRRDNRAKESVALAGLKARVEELLENIQKNLFQRAIEFRDKNTHRPQDRSEFKEIVAEKMGFLEAYWCGDPACEQAIKEETKATIRGISLNTERDEGRCIFCGKGVGPRVVFGRAY